MLLTLALAAPLTDLAGAEASLPPLDPVAPIIRGIEEPDHLAAVGLGFAGITVCTGSLITPELVLTAAHCTADFPDDAITAIGTVFFGTRTGQSEIRGILEVRVHPDYLRLDPDGSTLGENDVAVIVLAEPAPVDPVWFHTDPFLEADVLGATVRSVGWGLDENGDSYVKRSADLTIDELDPMFLISRTATNPGRTSICSGDSGGPQYAVVDGELIQWSIHSWASEECQGLSGSVRTDVVSDWILEQVADVHGSSGRCAAWGRLDDDVCDEDCDEPDPDCAVDYEVVVDDRAPTSSLDASGCHTAATSVWWPRRR